MKVASKPAINKEGFSKLTFESWSEEITTDYKTKENKVNPETGEVETHIALTFSIMDTTRQNPIKRTVKLWALGTPKSDLVLAGLGFTAANSTELDADGFLVDAVEIADDDFSQENNDLPTQVSDYLNSIVGKDFLAKVERNANGYWDINVSTLKSK